MTHKQRKLTEEEQNRFGNAANAIDLLPSWRELPEGREYWKVIFDRLLDSKRHGTSDGLPWVEPATEPLEPTDEFVTKFRAKHGRWPKVLVRDQVTDNWEHRKLIRATPNRDGDTYLAIDGNNVACVWCFCQLAPGEPREV